MSERGGEVDIHLHIHHHYDALLGQLERMEERMSQIDDKLTAFQTAVNDAFAKVDTALANITADETNLLQQIEELKNSLTDLTPDQQAKLDAVVTAANDMAARTQAVADAVPEPPTPETV